MAVSSAVRRTVRRGVIAYARSMVQPSAIAVEVDVLCSMCGGCDEWSNAQRTESGAVALCSSPGIAGPWATDMAPAANVAATVPATDRKGRVW